MKGNLLDYFVLISRIFCLCPVLAERGRISAKYQVLLLKGDIVSIRVAVIGAGYLGRHHARIFSGLEGAELAAVVDIEPARAEEVSAAYGCPAHTDYRNVLDDVQAVSVVTPTIFHYDIAMGCLRAGKDVLIEKPITATVEEADLIINEAEKRNAIVQVGHLERYNPAVVKVAEFIKRPEFIESERVSPFPNRGLDVDVTLDLMIHDIDIVMSLIEGAVVKDVRVVGAKVLTDKFDVAKAWVEFEGGVTALITASRISGQKQRKLKIYQEDSFVVLDYMKRNITRHFRKDSGNSIASESLDIEDREPLKEELIDFVKCVKERRIPKVSAVEGRDALDVALRITNGIRNSGG
jgi:predicted dehydrogenase